MASTVFWRRRKTNQQQQYKYDHLRQIVLLREIKRITESCEILQGHFMLLDWEVAIHHLMPLAVTRQAGERMWYHQRIDDRFGIPYRT